MKTTKSVFMIAVITFTSITAGLLLLMILGVFTNTEAKDAIIKLAEATGVIALASLVIFGVASASKN